MHKLSPLLILCFMISACSQTPTADNNSPSENSPSSTETSFEAFQPPIAFEVAKGRADSIIQLMQLDEKIAMIGGHNLFYTKGFEKYGIPSLYLSDATQGVNIRSELENQMEKSVAFPCPIALTSTWNTSLSQQYAQAIGEECRAGDIAVLLGPGVNLYRISQNGRNFEYFGEDPFLAARMVENYVVGMQSTGTIATLKHFIANNSDFRRRTSNSIVDQRTLHEIYMPAFEAGIDAGAMAIMTSYNLVNGEYSGQSKEVINGLLREDLGFKWLIMSDWWSVWDAEKVINSGLDLDMPGEPQDWMPGYARKPEFYLKNVAQSLIDEGKVSEADIDRMLSNILTTQIAMGLHDRPVKDTSYLNRFDQHIEVALQTARESMVLLKNDAVLPIDKEADVSILLTGEYATKIPRGGGSAEVEGYDQLQLLDALQAVYGDNIKYVEQPNASELQAADYVIYSVGTYDAEGRDKSFSFPKAVDSTILEMVSYNKNTIVVVSSGSGMQMSAWNDLVAGIIYSWYPGQIGFQALAEIIAGTTNPSGKLPITIEKQFEDSPGFPYLPNDEDLYFGWGPDMEILHPIHDIVYDEGVFVGYRWYEQQNIAPLYAFGHGLSYSNYHYSNLSLEQTSIPSGASLTLQIDIENKGAMDGKEIVQLYVRDVECSVERPLKELKGFKKVHLAAGEKKTIAFTLNERDFAFWDETTKDWKVEAGSFEIMVGSASDRILASTTIEITE